MLRYLPYLVLFALWIYALVDCLATPERDVRGMPKVVWVLIILFFGTVLLGPLAWLLIGRRRGRSAAAGATPAEWHRGYRIEDGTAAGGSRLGSEGEPLQQPQLVGWIPPDDNPEFLRSLSEQIRQNRERPQNPRRDSDADGDRDGSGRPPAGGE